ncbi:hypothetical protein [Nonomuraea fuscirosea]|uniref:hypothetical protein n=1 Tax=Nonomuraea fuscirosea TaxID=1291556 RepID=UPI003437AD7D
MSTDLPQASSNGHTPLNIAERVFQLLAGATAGPSLDGRTLSPELPQHQLPLTELRELLTARRFPVAARDAVWHELVTRAREEGPQWLMGAVGMALPTLRRICGQLSLYQLIGRPEAIESTVLSAFVAAVKKIDIDRPNILPRMSAAARRAGERARQKAEAGTTAPSGNTHFGQPAPAWADPILVLADAIGMEILGGLDPKLIERIRPTGQALAESAAPVKGHQQRESISAEAVVAGDLEPARSLAIASCLRKRAQDNPKTSARSRITSDPQPINTSSKGGRGSPTGSARSHTLLRRDGRGRFLRAALVAAVVAVALAVAVTAALAEPPPTVVHAAAPKDLNAVFDNLRNWLIGLLAALATLMLTIGGLRYLVAGGDPGEIQKAKAALKAAAFGYGLAVLAPLFVTVLKGIVGGA